MKTKTIYFILVLTFPILIVIEVLLLRRNYYFQKACNLPSIPVCYSDWTCKTKDGHDDNSMTANYSKIVKDKDKFVTQPTTPMPQNDALSTTPYYGCVEPAFKKDNTYQKLPSLPSGQTYKYGNDTLSKYNGKLIPSDSGIPAVSLFCTASTDNNPTPTFLPNTSK